MLWGRASESARLDALFAAAAAGLGGVVVVRGEPGVGKSALLSDASSRAPGARVLWTQGIESESPLAFAALHRLLRPVLPYLDRLPAPQTRALRGAFGEQDSPVADRFAVFLATLSLLSEAAEERTVIAVVDDAQWLDAASAEALLFVARRLQADRVALVFGAREGDIRTFHGDGLPELVLGGLDPVPAGALLAEFGLPVRLNARVTAVSRTAEGFAIRTQDSTLRARQVVVATGPFQVPFVPQAGQLLDGQVTQVHSAGYRNPAALPPGPVLVVGGGNSGFQIAEELAATRQVDLSIGTRAPVLPQRLAGKDLFWWLTRFGLMRVSVSSRPGRRMSSREFIIGGSRRRLQAAGIRFRPALADADGRTVRFADGTSLDVQTVIWASPAPASARRTSRPCASTSKPATSRPSWARPTPSPTYPRPYATWKADRHKEKSPSPPEAVPVVAARDQGDH
jgi:putative flavoprotein involved in K+ transport